MNSVLGRTTFTTGSALLLLLSHAEQCVQTSEEREESPSGATLITSLTQCTMAQLGAHGFYPTTCTSYRKCGVCCQSANSCAQADQQQSRAKPSTPKFPSCLCWAGCDRWRQHGQHLPRWCGNVGGREETEFVSSHSLKLALEAP